MLERMNEEERVEIVDRIIDNANYLADRHFEIDSDTKKVSERDSILKIAELLMRAYELQVKSGFGEIVGGGAK